MRQGCHTFRFSLLAVVLAAAMVGGAWPAAPQNVAGIPAVELDVPFVPTRHPVVARMLTIAGVGPDDYVVDLGSGDGRVVIAAARDHGARGFGVDIDPRRIAEAEANARGAGVAELVAFRRQDLFATDFRRATVLTMYLLPSVNLRLRPRVLDELRPGTRVVSHAFDMGDWAADDEDLVDGARVYLWIVPARVDGRWDFRDADGEEMTVTFAQTYQAITGSARVGARIVPLQEATLRGDRIRFTVDTGSGVRTFAGRVDGDAMTAVPTDGPALAGWQAVKVP